MNKKDPPNELQWEIHYQKEYQGDSLLLMKAHHSISDGNGFYSMLIAMNDDKFELMMPKFKPPPKWKMWILNALSPLFIPYMLYKHHNFKPKNEESLLMTS